MKIFSSPENLITELSFSGVNRAAVSSVVPALTSKIADMVKKNLNVSPLIISRSSRFDIKINYDTPETLGIDRICSAEGAFCVFKKSKEYDRFDSKTFLVSIDFGTATTINIVGYPGTFMGGIITPGIKTMISSLKLNTAQLPEIDFENYKGVIGKDTKSSIASGIINSAAGLIEKTFLYLKTELNATNINTYITGGNAPGILPHLNFKYVYERGLVLKGIRSVCDLNK